MVDLRALHHLCRVSLPHIDSSSKSHIDDTYRTESYLCTLFRSPRVRSSPRRLILPSRFRSITFVNKATIFIVSLFKLYTGENIILSRRPISPLAPTIIRRPPIACSRGPRRKNNPPFFCCNPIRGSTFPNCPFQTLPRTFPEDKRRLPTPSPRDDRCKTEDRGRTKPIHYNVARRTGGQFFAAA